MHSVPPITLALPLALTRKNALFVGSDGGAEHWAGVASLADPADEPDTVALRALNCVIKDDERVDRVLLPVGPGMTFVRRR